MNKLYHLPSVFFADAIPMPAALSTFRVPPLHVLAANSDSPSCVWPALLPRVVVPPRRVVALRSCRVHWVIAVRGPPGGVTTLQATSSVTHSMSPN